MKHSFTCPPTTLPIRSVRQSFHSQFFVALKQLILSHPKGLKEEQKLRVCYRGLEQDLEQLKAEGWVRSIITNKKEIVLFPINLLVRDRSKRSSLAPPLIQKPEYLAMEG